MTPVTQARNLGVIFITYFSLVLNRDLEFKQPAFKHGPRLEQTCLILEFCGCYLLNICLRQLLAAFTINLVQY